MLCAAGGEQGRPAEAGRQQDRVRAARVRAGAGPELRAGARGISRGQDLQGVHVQLGPQVDEHRRQTSGRRLPTLLQGSLGNRSQEVRRPAFLLNYNSGCPLVMESHGI